MKDCRVPKYVGKYVPKIEMKGKTARYMYVLRSMD